MGYVFLDVETSSTDPRKGSILEIALILTDENLHRVEEFKTLVRSKHGITRASYTIHGISEKMLVDAPSFGEIAEHVRKLLLSGTVVGFKIFRFDLRFINWELFRSGNFPVFPRFIDLYEVFGERSLISLARRFRIRIGRTHRAFHDAETVLRIFRMLEYPPRDRLFYYNRTIMPLLEFTNNKQLCKVIYRTRRGLVELVGFALEVDRYSRVLFYDRIRSRFFLLNPLRISGIHEYGLLY